MAKTFTYIIDNVLIHYAHVHYYVEAPEDFEDWFRDLLVPWLRRRSLTGQGLVVLGRCPSVEWRREGWATSYQDFLSDDSVVAQFDRSEDPPLARPTYVAPGPW